MLHPIDFVNLVGLRESNMLTWAYHCLRGKLPSTVGALTTVPETLQFGKSGVLLALEIWRGMHPHVKAGWQLRNLGCCNLRRGLINLGVCSTMGDLSAEKGPYQLCFGNAGAPFSIKSVSSISIYFRSYFGLRTSWRHGDIGLSFSQL